MLFRMIPLPFCTVRGAEGISKTSLSLLVTREPVVFGEKKARVIFCLASRDGKEHIPAVVTLMRMVKTTACSRSGGEPVGGGTISDRAQL